MAETMIDCETVMPDLPGNPWPIPRGYPVKLDDGKAYFFACASGSGRGEVLCPLLDEAQGAEQAFTMAEDGKPGTFSGFAKAVEKLALASLALQYSNETVDRIAELGIGANHYPEVIRSIAGAGPGYRVATVKK